MARSRRGVDHRKLEAERALAMKAAHAQEEEWAIADLWRGQASPRCAICGAPLLHLLLSRCTWCGAERRDDA